MAQHQHELNARRAGRHPRYGPKLLAVTVLAAAGRGDRAAIAKLTSPIDLK